MANPWALSPALTPQRVGAPLPAATHGWVPYPRTRPDTVANFPDDFSACTRSASLAPNIAGPTHRLNSAHPSAPVIVWCDWSRRTPEVRILFRPKVSSTHKSASALGAALRSEQCNPCRGLYFPANPLQCVSSSEKDDRENTTEAAPAAADPRCAPPHTSSRPPRSIPIRLPTRPRLPNERAGKTQSVHRQSNSTTCPSSPCPQRALPSRPTRECSARYA